MFYFYILSLRQLLNIDISFFIYFVVIVFFFLLILLIRSWFIWLPGLASNTGDAQLKQQIKIMKSSLAYIKL